MEKDRRPVTIDHNLYYCAAGPQASRWAAASDTVSGFDKYVQSTGNDSHSHFSDPLFVDPAQNDFHVRSDSPAIAAGITEGLPVGEVDLEGSPRLKSGKIDIGCYEKH